MIYFVTGITGTVVPVIVEDLMKKDKDPVFYFALRKDAKGNGIEQRFAAVVNSLDLDHAAKQVILKKSKLVEIDVEKDNLGIDPDLYAKLIANTDKILHGAADVRFDQPYEKIRLPNVVFTHENLRPCLMKSNSTARKTANPRPRCIISAPAMRMGITGNPFPKNFLNFIQQPRTIPMPRPRQRPSFLFWIKSSSSMTRSSFLSPLSSAGPPAPAGPKHTICTIL